MAQPAPDITPDTDPEQVVIDLIEGKQQTKNPLLRYFVEQARQLLEDGKKAHAEYSALMKRKQQLEDAVTGIKAALTKYRDDIENHLDQLEK
jgi:HPt (histidine-containing phosphotransfer) domain-containing protein